MRQARQISIWASRSVIGLAGGLSLASYFWSPVGPLLAVLDLLGRAYLNFLLGAMAHEASHGHLGNSRSSNQWWGRLALLPVGVVSVVFRKTHLHHHAHTNEPGLDPDYFLHTEKRWQIPLRAVAMPYQWLYWIQKNRIFNRREWLEYGLTILGFVAVFCTIGWLTGFGQMLIRLIFSEILHGFLLWYVFALRTHDGYSTGAAEERSHNYAGRLLHFLSGGLSMHRIHHMRPGLSWLESWKDVLTLRRDIRTS
jgi:beta-carotene hydroxylase